jgi:hypothetical protein
MTRRSRLAFNMMIGVASLLVLNAGHARLRMPEAASATDPDSGVIAHEWGTFTTIAGADGRAMPWLPLATSSDLPCFVRLLNPTGGKGGLADLEATVRMETPVIYFYSSAPRDIQVRIALRHGIITEWYPEARVSPMALSASMGPRDVGRTTGTIQWDDVRVTPGAAEMFARENGTSHYYAARATDATPLSVGAQREKFLFYRGLADFPVDLTARAGPADRVIIENLSSSPIESLILFQRRGDRMGFRVLRDLRHRITVDTPALDGRLDSLRTALEQALVRQGLYPREAHAMVETWRDSWFEAGMRVFYLVPRPDVDGVLPLDITPPPSRTVRAFVGRIEIVTPRMADDVVSLVHRGDYAALSTYPRTLGAILERAGRRITSSERAATDSAWAALQPAGSSCPSSSR